MPIQLSSDQIASLPADFVECYSHQRHAYFAHPIPTYEERLHDLSQLAAMLRQHQSALVEAINADFGNRSAFETLSYELFVLLDNLKATKKQLKKWMRVQHRQLDFSLFPAARNRVIPQPLGIVGVIVPWNYPLYLSFAPLISIFAAGNRAMVKMSEFSQNLVTLLQNISPDFFPEDKLKFFADDLGKGVAFSKMPFDHLFFTGSSAVGKMVMASAAQNLTPVTLELGGKVPAIVAPDFSIQTAAERILWVKLLNAGQICTSVDYAFLPENSLTEFVSHCQQLLAQRYPDLNGTDYTSIIAPRFFQRLEALLDDAQQKGAQLIALAPEQQPDPQKRRFPPYIVLNATPDMRLMQEEIFGPILPVLSYRSASEVAHKINEGERPLAIYPFTHDKNLQQFYIDQVMSGGVCVNDTLQHLGQNDLPFGGVGASGMGHYHGFDGFQTFSKMRPVFYQGPLSGVQLLFQPPYGKRSLKLIRWMLRWRT